MHSQNKKNILFSTLKMALATFSSRILGLVREQVMAALFGASSVTDAFTVAYRVPNMLRDLFAEGAFSSAFVPVFTEVYQKDKKKARELMWALFIILFTITGLISALIILNADFLITLVTNKDFYQDPNRFSKSVLMVKVMAPFLTLVSLAALMMGVLNTLKVFFIPSFAPAFFNISMILCMSLLPSFLKIRGLDISLSLAIGVIIGGLLQLIVQVPLIIKKGFGPIIPKVIFSKDSKKVLNRVGIGTIGVAATQINILVTTILATGTGVGAVSWLTYSFRLFQFPVGIFGVSIAGSNLVHFSDKIKSNKLDEAREIFKTSLFFILFIMLPSAVFLIFYAEDCVRIIFERGAFSADATLKTSIALKYYALGLPFYGMYKLMGPVFFAIDKPKLPIFISMFSILLNIIFCLLFISKWGYVTLAIGVSLSIFVNIFLQSIFINKELKLGLKSFINLKIIKLVISAIVTFYILKAWQFQAFEGSLLFQIFGLIIEAIKTFLIYLILLVGLGEWKSFSPIIKKLSKKF